MGREGGAQKRHLSIDEQAMSFTMEVSIREGFCMHFPAACRLNSLLAVDLGKEFSPGMCMSFRIIY